MRDNDILRRFFQRDESAIATLKKEYGEACRRIAAGILPDERDAEECVNDALLRLWETIPPANPDNLRAYLFAAVRNSALSIHRKNTANKRGGAESPLSLMEELGQSESYVDEPDMALLADSLNRFLAGLSRDQRIVFVRRYYYGLSYADIARSSRLSQKNVSVILTRLRQKLKDHLEKEGFTL